jgi:hypothetical protein
MSAKLALKPIITLSYQSTNRNEFIAGTYIVIVFAKLAGRSQPIELKRIPITVSAAHAGVLAKKEGVLFELGRDRDHYIGHARDGS